MKLGDVYKHKKDNSIIQIDSFATHMGHCDPKSFVIVFKQIVKHNEYETGYSPSDNGYGTQEEIEKKYDLLIEREKLNEYKDWNEIFELVN